MATSKTPEPTPAPARISPEGIAKSGEGLIRLWVAAFTLPITIANAIGVSLTRAVSSATATLDGAPVPQSDNEVVKATGDLFNATGKLYTSLLNAAIASLEGAARSINEAVADPSASPPK